MAIFGKNRRLDPQEARKEHGDVLVSELRIALARAERLAQLPDYLLDGQVEDADTEVLLLDASLKAARKAAAGFRRNLK